jgi:predicted HTH transcriptional regulator
MYRNVCYIYYNQYKGGVGVKIKELYPDAITEDLEYEYKVELNPDNPIKWAKTIVGYANGKGGIIFVGVSNEGEAFGISLDDIDKIKNLVARINDRHIFPHVKIKYTMRSVDEDADKFVLGLKVEPADSIIRYREGDYNGRVFTKGDGSDKSPKALIKLKRK